jgi:Tfp pilus assembly protein PilN
MKVRLNLATAPLENDRRFVFGYALVGTLAVIVLLALSWRAYSIRKANEARRVELAQIESEMSQLSAQRSDLETFFNDPNVVEIRDRSTFLNGLIEERSFPWTRIFMDFENLLPEGARVTSISPHLVPGNIDHVELTLKIGATSDEAGLKFLRALETSKSFSHIALKSETRPDRPADIDRVNYEISAWYTAAGDAPKAAVQIEPKQARTNPEAHNELHR